MKVLNLIKELQKMAQEHGNLNVVIIPGIWTDYVEKVGFEDDAVDINTDELESVITIE